MSKREKTYEFLGKIVSLELDQLRLQLANLQNERTTLASQIDQMRESERIEAEVAAMHPKESITMPVYGAYTRTTLDRLQKDIAKLDGKIEEFLDGVRHHFQESKKLEIAQEREALFQLKQENKKEQAFYDQIAETRHSRRRPKS